MDKRCERLAKQIVGMIGRKARTILKPACNIEHFLRTRLDRRFSELEKLPSQPNLYRLRALIEWEVDLLDFHLKCVKKYEGGEFGTIDEMWRGTQNIFEE
jgi:hypothetical protein